MWERFSYYGMRAILVLFMTASLAEGGLGIEKAEAKIIYGWFTGLVYLTPLIGGFIADNYLGRRKSITIGGVLMMLGQFALGFSHGNMMMFWLGLGLLCFGNGFFKPNISTIVGDLYGPKDSRRDAAFTIFYMGINLGALLAPLVVGIVTKSDTNPTLGYKWGFIISGIGMLLGQISYNFFGNKYIGDLGNVPSAKLRKQQAQQSGTSNHALTDIEKDRLLVIFIMMLFTMFFWMGFEQAGSSMNLYTDTLIDRQIGSFEVKTSYFQSINPLFILLLAPLFSSLWLSLASKGKEPNIPVKMGIGMILLGVGFMFMVGACIERGETLSTSVADVNIKANLLWLIMAYFLHTTAELCISPVGLSMITKLAPMQYASLMMGAWFGSVFVANVAGGYLAAYVEVLGAYKIFGGLAVSVIILGLILLGVSGKIKKLMHGIS